MKKVKNHIIAPMKTVNQKQIDILGSIQIIRKEDIQEQMLPKFQKTQSSLDLSSEWFLMETFP